MNIPELAPPSGIFGLISLAYMAFQLRTGKSLWGDRLVSRQDSGRQYWAGVRGSAVVGALLTGFAIWVTLAANPTAPDPSVPVVQGADIVVHGGSAAKPDDAPASGAIAR